MQTADKIKALMLEKRLKICAAESFTGGAVAAALTAIAGASEWFYESVVCYSNESKINRLGVNPEIIEAHGAVSFACCKAMLEGLLNVNPCEVAVATTGFAGPPSGGGEPVGLCFVGAAYRKNLNETPKIVVERHILGKNRQENIKNGAELALKCVQKLLCDI